MRKVDSFEEYAQIVEEMKKLDEKIEVPFAATAQGLKARLVSEPLPAKPVKWRKIAASVASFALVSLIGLGIFWSQTPLFRGARSAAPQNAMFEDALEDAPADPAQSQSAYAQPPVIDGINPDTDGSTALDLNPVTGGGEQAEILVQNNLRQASSYEDLQQVVANCAQNIPAKPPGMGGGDIEAKEQSAATMENPTTAGGENGMFLETPALISYGQFDYAIDLSAEGTAKIQITPVSAKKTDATATIQTDFLDTTVFFVQDTLLLAGNTEEGAMLACYNIENPLQPQLEESFAQRGRFENAFLLEDTFVFSSSYALESETDYRPLVYSADQATYVPLEAQQVLYTEDCVTPVYTMITAVSLPFGRKISHLAVLGGGEFFTNGTKIFLNSPYTNSAFSFAGGELVLEP